jgi:hypothetical protein
MQRLIILGRRYSVGWRSEWAKHLIQARQRARWRALQPRKSNLACQNEKIILLGTKSPKAIASAANFGLHHPRTPGSLVLPLHRAGRFAPRQNIGLIEGP